MLEKHHLKLWEDQKVVSIEDYQSSESIDLLSGEKSVIDIPKSNVLIYLLKMVLK